MASFSSFVGLSWVQRILDALGEGLSSNKLAVNRASSLITAPGRSVALSAPGDCYS
jgi:hypothetical protein